jgi:hypothetical protein
MACILGCSYHCCGRHVCSRYLPCQATATTHTACFLCPPRSTVLSSTGEPGESSRASKAPGAAASLLAGSGYMPGVGTAADVPYAVQAARRSEKRRLLGFVKRLELMVADGARTALLQTTAGMLQAIQAQIAVGTPKHNQVGVVLKSPCSDPHCAATCPCVV